VSGLNQAHIRRALPADAPLLPAIERSAGMRFRSIPALAWLADADDLPVERYRTLIAAGASWIAEDGDGTPIGFLCAEAAGTALHIWELAVALDRQRGGTGRALIRQAIMAAHACGLRTVTLTTFRSVPWNAPAYRAMGFVIVPDEDIDERLSILLDAEANAGLSRADRCAMQFVLPPRSTML
jgi:GNAT superfamily N-acetyltransferase